MPAMTERSVVLPQPEGPTSISNSPARTSRSTPRKACTAPVPWPKVFLRPLQRTARPFWFGASITKLTPENDRGLEFDHLPNAQEGCANTDEQHGAAAQRQQLPRQTERQFGVLGRDAEQRGRPDPKSIAQPAHHQRLQDNHAQQSGVGRSHRLERSE